MRSAQLDSQGAGGADDAGPARGQPGEPTITPLARVLRALCKSRGSRRWDLVLRAAALVAAASIPIVILFPERIPLVWFGLLALPANGPLSPVIPMAFEPLILEAAKYEAAHWVALVGLCVYMYMEYINWHVYGWVVHQERLTRFRHHRVVQYAVKMFAVHPFATVIFFAVTPVPFWVARVLALVRGYPVRRFMLATAIGRAPRLWLVAYVGARLQLQTTLLLGILATTTLAALVWARRQRRGESTP